MNILVLSSPVTDVLDEGGATSRKLLAAHPECNWRFVSGRAYTQADVCWADIIVGNPNPSYLKAAVNLKWLHLQTAGVNGYEQRALYPNPDVLVNRAAGGHSVSIAEHAIAMALSLSRKLPALYAHQQAHLWQPVAARYELSGATALLLGTGYLASALIPRLKGFGCRILGLRRDAGKPVPPDYDAIYTTAELSSAMEQADYLFNTVPLTVATKGLVNDEVLAHAKPNLIVINVGRGGTMDTGAILQALREGRIAGAGLDVTEPEPLPPDNPLWDLPNVIITPHCSARSDNTDFRQGQIFLEQLDKFLAGRPLDGLIDFEAGY